MPTNIPCFHHFHYILSANLGSLLHGDVYVMRAYMYTHIYLRRGLCASSDATSSPITNNVAITFFMVISYNRRKVRNLLYLS